MIQVDGRGDEPLPCSELAIGINGDLDHLNHHRKRSRFLAGSLVLLLSNYNYAGTTAQPELL